MPWKKLEVRAWRLIGMAKIASDKTRRKMLMQEAFDLVSRAISLRQLDPVNGRSSTGERGYRMRLSNGTGTTLWVYLRAESRADAIWAANALRSACSDCFEDYDLWDSANHLLSAATKLPSYFFPDSAEEDAITSQYSLLDTMEVLVRSEVALARSRKLLEATAALRDRLTRREN